MDKLEKLKSEIVRKTIETWKGCRDAGVRNDDGSTNWEYLNISRKAGRPTYSTFFENIAVAFTDNYSKRSLPWKIAIEIQEVVSLKFNTQVFTAFKDSIYNYISFLIYKRIKTILLKGCDLIEEGKSASEVSKWEDQILQEFSVKSAEEVADFMDRIIKCNSTEELAQYLSECEKKIRY